LPHFRSELRIQKDAGKHNSRAVSVRKSQTDVLQSCGLANDRTSMLWTTANPTDGLRFERRNQRPLNPAHPEVFVAA
jgi:hypothetical protein